MLVVPVVLPRPSGPSPVGGRPGRGGGVWGDALAADASVCGRAPAASVGGGQGAGLKKDGKYNSRREKTNL